MKPHSYQVGQETQLGSLGIMVNVIVLWQTVCTQAALEHLAANGYPLHPAEMDGACATGTLAGERGREGLTEAGH